MLRKKITSEETTIQKERIEQNKARKASKIEQDISEVSKCEQNKKLEDAKISEVNESDPSKDLDDEGKPKKKTSVFKLVMDLLAMILLVVSVVVTWRVVADRTGLLETDSQEVAEIVEKHGTYCTIKSNSLDGIPIYSEAGSDVQVGLLPEGKCCEVKATTEYNGQKWTKVNYAGLEGWTKSKRVFKVSEDDFFIKTGDTVYMNAFSELGICLYKDPSGISDVVADGIHYGEEFQIEEITDGWAKVTYNDIPAYLNLFFVGSYTPREWKVESKMRSGEIYFKWEPSDDAGTICMIPEDTPLTITDYDHGWGYCEYQGQNGWVKLHHMIPAKK